MTTVPHKRCRKCDEVKPLDDFSADRRNLTDGRQSRCKACNRQYRLDNAVAIKKRKSAEYARDKKRILEVQRVRRSKDRRRWAEYSRNYYREHPDKYVGHTQRRRARMNAVDCGCVGAGHLVFLRALPCTYCGAPAEHIDHIHPLSKGGLHCLGNLTPACASCNLAKSATVLDDPPPSVLNCPKNSSEQDLTPG